MSKKLIAVAAAAALALTGLVAIPASAAAFSVTPTGQIGVATAGTTSTDALTINAPSQNVIRLDEDTASTTTGTLVRFAVVTTAAGNVKVDATAGIKLITQAQVTAGLADLTSTSGVDTLTVATNSSAEVNVYAYATSTTAGTVTVNQVGTSNSKVVFLKAVSAKTNSYKLNFTASSSSAAGGDISFSGTVTDMFGNLMTLTNADLAVDGVGGNLAAGITTTDLKGFVVNSTTKVHTFKVVNRDSNGAAAMSLKLVTATAEATKVTAFGDLVNTQFFAINAVDLSAANTALTAQVAALTAQLANSRSKDKSVTKKKFNNLARKWNAANPSARVALKK